MKAAIYVRVSTLDQAREGYSLDAQEKALREHCNSRGFEVYKVYADRGISAKDIENRPALQELMRDVRKFDAIAFWSLSRFTRSVSDLYSTLELLEAHNISVFSYTESIDTSTPAGRAMLGVLGVFAQLERELTAERIKAALCEKAMQHCKTCSYIKGYDAGDRKKLLMNEEEANCVRTIFNLYMRHQSLTKVANMCTNMGLTGKRGKPFRANSIRAILTNKVYCGYNNFKGKTIKGTHKNLVSVRKFNAVQELLCKNGRR